MQHYIQHTQASHGSRPARALCSCGQVLRARNTWALARVVEAHLKIKRR